MRRRREGEGGLKVAVEGDMRQDRNGRGRRKRKMGTASGSDAGGGRRQHGIRWREWDLKRGGYNDGGRRRGWEWVN